MSFVAGVCSCKHTLLLSASPQCLQQSAVIELAQHFMGSDLHLQFCCIPCAFTINNTSANLKNSASHWHLSVTDKPFSGSWSKKLHWTTFPGGMWEIVTASVRADNSVWEEIWVHVRRELCNVLWSWWIEAQKGRWEKKKKGKKQFWAWIYFPSPLYS